MFGTHSRLTQWANASLLALLAFTPLLSTTVQAAPVESANITKRAPAWPFPYGSTKVRGVNLGGWLVLEPWITPSLFDATGDSRIIDEYTFGQYQEYNKAHNALVNHWNTWITYNDFVQIKNAGLNHIRLPIGYWAWDVTGGEPYHQGQLSYLTSAIGWARQLGLKIIIDLHGAPGSQNGFDNSGQKKSYPLWHTNASNVQRCNNIIKTLASWYSSQTDVVVGIAPLNEPAGFFGNDVLSVTRQYWYDSYGNIRYPYGTSQQGAILEVIHDAFQPLDYWSGFPPNSFDGVIMDTHYYGVFSQGEVSRSWDQQVQAACARSSAIRNFYLWTIVGEWSLAFTDCAKYLNGRGVGARYDGTYPGSSYVGTCAPFTGSGANFSSSYKAFLRRFWEAQVTSFESNAGWIYWTWKAENADEWSYSAGLRYGWIPQNPTDRIYPNVCG
ncbi:putative EXG1-exo-beta-1,3-glucanase, major isoform [Serendipita vermifera]|nr:putative EXG1-exo-beta-1,3-glucanase, major isoform [Serendipita vermifera]